MQEVIKKITSSLGRILIEWFFKKEDIDMYKIKDWLYKNKKRLGKKFMNMNERYIFFEEYKGE